jgi:uncharacterized heparinase superfamily protein
MSSLPAQTRWSREPPSSREEAAAPRDQPATRAPSPLSAPEERSEAATGPPPRRPQRRPNLLREAARAALDRAADALLDRLRGSFLYPFTLGGSVADRIAVYPSDARPRSLEEADNYFRNRFAFAGHVVDAKDGSIFDCKAPGDGFAAELHGFEFLRHLEAAGGDDARKLALQLTGEWLDRYERYRKPAWRPEIIATRLLNIFCHGRFFLANSELTWRSSFFVSLRNQTRVLARTAKWAPEGIARLEAAAALTLSGLCLSDGRNTSLGLTRLVDEIGRQILADGGHVNRSPQTLLGALLVLDLVQQALDATGGDSEGILRSAILRSALERVASMVRYFRLGDGGLAVFNGGGESDPRLVSALLARDDAKGKLIGYAPQSRYQRAAAGRSILIMDVGGAPPGPHATEAHAGCHSFEMSSGEHRLIVNCGTAVGDDESWREALRASAAHSTLVIADTSSANALGPGWLRNLLGARLIDGGATVESRRSETMQGLVIEGGHDLYLPRFGVIHERRVVLSHRGTSLAGNERLTVRRPRSGKRPKLPFALRFHIHPDIRLSLAQGGGSVILKLPNGEGWRFRCGGGSLTIEESVYLGGGILRRAEQLVVAGHIRDEEVECVWLLEQLGAT